MIAVSLSCAQGEALDDAAIDATAMSTDAPRPVDGPTQNFMADAAIDAAPQGPCAAPGSDGTVCAPTTNPCLRPGLCQSGVCGAITNAPDGTVCATAPDACHTDGRCQAGACGAIGVRPDGYNYASGDLNRCCGGVPVQTNTSQHCGVCGIHCGANACINVGGAWQCACTASADCWSNCCSTSAG